MIGGWTAEFKARLDSLLGLRGPKPEHAVRFKDLDKVLTATTATAKKLEQVEKKADAAKQAAEQAAGTSFDPSAAVAESQRLIDQALEDARQAARDADRIIGEHNVLVQDYQRTTDEIKASIGQSLRAGLLGWVTDPAFTDWTDGVPNPANWPDVQLIEGRVAQFAGMFGGGLEARVAEGSAADLTVCLRAKEGMGLTGSNAAVEWVVATIVVEYIEGTPLDAFFRPQWSGDEGVTWVNGLIRGADGTGSFNQIGISPNPGVVQSLDVLVQRPAGVFDQVRLGLHPRGGARTSAQHMKVHCINLRAATPTEIDAASIGPMQSTISQQAITLTTLTDTVAQMGTTLSSVVGSTGRIIFAASEPPVADRVPTALWIDLTGGANTPKRWTGTAWVAIPDKTAAEALAAAAAVSALLSSSYMTAANTTTAITEAVDAQNVTIGNLAGALTDLKGLKASALTGTVMGVLMTQLGVNAGGTSATITNMGSAISDLEGNASAIYAFRVKAGSANALLELVAASSPAGAVSVARIGASQILLEGSVTARELAVGDFTNHASGSDFEDGAIVPWNLSSLHVRTQATAKSGTWSLQTNPGAGQSVLLTPIDCSEGDQFYVSLWARRNGAFNGTEGNSKLRFGNLNGGALIAGLPYALANLPTANVWVKREMTVTVPAGVTRMNVSLLNDNTAGQVFLDDIEIRRKTGGVLIENGAVRASHLVTSEAVITNSLQVGNGTIGNLAIKDDIQSTTFVAGSAGWRIRKTGAAEFNAPVISRNLRRATDTFSITENFGANNNFAFTKTFIRGTGVEATPWDATKETFVATAGMIGAAITPVSGQFNNCEFGFSAEIISITRPGPNDAFIWLRIELWTRNITYLQGTVRFNVYEVT